MSNAIAKCIIFALSNPGGLSNSLNTVINQLPFNEYADHSAKREILATYIKKHNAEHNATLEVSSLFVKNNVVIVTDNKSNLIESNCATYSVDLNRINSISALQSIVLSMHDALLTENLRLSNEESKKADAIIKKYLSECSYTEIEHIEKYISQYRFLL